MEWQIGPLEGKTGTELAATAKAAYQETYGAETGPLAELRREQFDGVIGCLDHQVGAFERGAGMQLTINGNATTAADASDAPCVEFGIVQLFREPSERFARSAQASREHAGTTGGPGG